MAQVMVPFTRSVGSSGDTVETDEEEEVVARIAILHSLSRRAGGKTVLCQRFIHGNRTFDESELIFKHREIRRKCSLFESTEL